MKNIIIILAIATALPTIASPPLSMRAKILLNIKSDRVSCFVNSVWNEAKRVQQEYGVPMAVVIGQACLESGYGYSRLAREDCNFFGTKLDHEYCRYKNKAESFSHYGRTMTQRCYKNINPYTLSDWYESLKCCGYAGDSEASDRYVKKLNNIIFKLNLDLIHYN